MKEVSNKVKDVYQIDSAMLENIAFSEKKGDFFQKSLNFYNQIKEKDSSLLSKKQKNWLLEIENSLNKRKSKELKKDLNNQKTSFLNRILNFFKN